MGNNDEKSLKDEIESLVRVGYDSSKEIERSGSFLVVDDKQEESSSEEESLIILPISFALKEYPWAEDLLFSLVDRDKDKWTEKVAGAEELVGSFIYVKEGVTVKFPAQSCFFLHDQDFEQRIHNIIVLEPGSKLDVITGCATGNLVKSGRHVAVTEIFIKEKANLNFTMIHDWGAETKVYPRTAIKMDKNSSYNSNYIALTKVKKIQSNPVAILSDGASARFSSIVYGRPDSYIDMGYRAILDGEGANSEIISRVVSERSRIIARGYIEGRQAGTRGHMECNGLLLDKDSSVYAVPELEAKNPETDLSHEAAVGKIAGEKLNYLMSRGLEEDEARSLIVRGFLEAGIQGLPEGLQERVDSMVEKAASMESI